MSSYELGQDITRYLENEPIHARRASLVYQLKMFARRNRAVVATVITIGIALVFATVVSVYAGIRASQAQAEAIVDRDRAVAAEQAVSIERDRAVEAERTLSVQHAQLIIVQKKAEEALKDAEYKLGLLRTVGVFNEELLSMGTPRNAQGKMCTVLDIALQAVDKIDQEFTGVPLLEAPARRAIGELLWELGELEQAKVQLSKAIQVFKMAKDSFRPDGLLHAY